MHPSRFLLLPAWRGFLLSLRHSPFSALPAATKYDKSHHNMNLPTIINTLQNICLPVRLYIKIATIAKREISIKPKAKRQIKLLEKQSTPAHPLFHRQFYLRH
ncbi:hypothetical protein ACI1AD_002481 [Cronobacter dublinensis]